MRRTRYAALLVLLLAGCAAAPSKPIAPSAAVPADDNLNAVAWTQTAVEHDLVYREVYRDAEEKLAAALADPTWDALPRDERGNSVASLPPAVILDIDETVLDNSPYAARLVRDGKEFDASSWALWCKEGIAKPLPGALAFTRAAAARGVAVFYLSNRTQDLNAATLANLRADGFPVAGEDSFLGLGTLVPGCAQVGSEKGCRRKLIAQRYRVLMQFGDQLGDFLDVLDNTPNGRVAAVQPYLDWVGQRWFVLPNPTYGSWEPALFGNDGAQPLPQRRAAKRAALRVQ
ncbi:MAG: HAD family acid phosphatase [Mizugakiibacter sp.]|uniref:5'-nucleotidase, lipoprotein e(P4) family n=1 Tax=Mizugakiibacter sp. TaxID=1972610 RepID=UPI0031C0D085|nr:acid phosphatase [Xanthomonadaceae bacterium]